MHASAIWGLRRHRPLGLTVAAIVFVLSAVAAACGPSSMTATREATADTSLAETASEAPPADPSSAPTQPLIATSLDAAATGLFNSSTLHEISISFAQEDYEAMIQTYQQSGEKEWIDATVSIDGEIYKSVGVRLKGNSSIMGLRGGDVGGSTRPGGQPGFGPMGGDASTDVPETLPWLIDLDRNVDNQDHDGFIELAVRSSTTETALNEAVSLELLRQAGLASQEAVYVCFSVNGSEPRLRLVVENPDDSWMARNFATWGALYKAESTGDYSYRGDDPDSYDEVFDQEAGKTNADLAPLIEFLDFINNSDDATFKAELPDHLDIEAFATYLAMEELLGNFDDIDGPGNNSYLYYDTKTEKFTVVPWDHNLAFRTASGMGGWMGGFGGKGGAPRPQAAREGFNGGPPEGTLSPQDMQDLQDMQVPQGQQAPGGAEGQIGAGPGPSGRSNILVERFKADPEWERLYEERLSELRITLYESGKAADVLAYWVTLLKQQAPDLVDADTVDEEAALLSGQFEAE